MGVVYRAFDIKLERTVALKFLPDHLVFSDEQRKRVLREARTASGLDHLNIGVIHGFEDTDDHHVFIVMAYYEGETLAQKLRGGPLPLAEAVEIGIQIADGLAAAHAGAVVHRDIKPSNIIITQRGVAKIVDFGLARLSAAGGSTQSISSGGTVGYMSPEQAMGKIVDQRTDIWSLGCTLAEMVTGRNPFQRDSAGATVLAILNEGPLPMDEVPPDLLRIIYHALAKEPETRYQTCAELLADLKDFRGQVERATSTPKLPRSTSSLSKELRLHMEQASRSTWRTTVVPQTHWQRWIVLLGALAAVLAVLSFLPPVRQRITQWSGPQEQHIAVLPFDNPGNDPSMQAVSDGLMDSMTDELSNLSTQQKSLWVIPSSVIRSRKITEASEAARELGANMVVRGSIQKSGQTFHLTVHLIDAKNLRQIGAASLDDSAGDIASLQTQAVSRLAQLMNINVTADMLKSAGGNVAPASYELYLKALGFMQRYDKPGNLDAAINALRSAVDADPRFAVGYAQLGEAYRIKYRVDKDPRWIDEATANCQRAIQIDKRLPAAYVTLARLHEANGKNDLALEEFQKAIALDPRNAEALRGLAGVYENTGHQKEAEENFLKAAALRPDYWDGYDELGLYYDRQNKFPQAIAQLKKAAELTPDNAQVYSNLGAIYIDSGDPKLLPEAEKALNKSVSLTPSYPAYANLASLLFRQKRYSESANMWEAALKLNDRDYLVWSYLANTYDAMNQPDKAKAARDRMTAILEPFVKDHPQDALAQSTLASAYARNPLTLDAETRIQGALALAPDDSAVLENAADTYERLGDRKKAIAMAEKSLAKGNNLETLQADFDLIDLLKDPGFHAK
jgi:serine/threonine protein kinase/tetratricopeptide (TPR) repeat protein